MVSRETDDLRIVDVRPLMPPAILLEELPASDAARATVSRIRGEIHALLEGQDDRMLVVVGPCSIHDVDAARAYGEQLAELAPALAGELCIVMRTYFEKPRTIVGWKGLINDPQLDGTFAINRGLRLARGLLLDLLELGVASGTEFLDTITPQFVADLIAWGAIGARTTESQVHRELASGLSMPVGFKNGTDGNVQIAVDAIRAASHPHQFLSVTKQGLHAIVETRGNPRCHVILRGGQREPNHGPEHVERAAGLLERAQLSPRLMIDASHGNSGKDPQKQVDVVDSIAQRVRGGERRVFGVMIESHLLGGRQELRAGEPLVFGQSVTDACLAWSETVPLLESLAAAVRARRQRHAPSPREPQLAVAP